MHPDKRRAGRVVRKVRRKWRRITKQFDLLGSSSLSVGRAATYAGKKLKTDLCLHLNKRGIYGDEIIFATPGFKRLQCVDCGKFLDGHVIDKTVE